MSTTSYYSSYEHQRQRKAEERKNAPKACPHCGTPINEHLSEWDRVRYHCGADKCRKAASRHNIAERKRQERSQAHARILMYCEQQLDRDQKLAVMGMCDMLMEHSYEEGHEIAERVVQVIEAQRCKHDRIAELEQNAAIWKRRALKSEEQLQARIRELEEEMQLFNGLEATIHGIAQRQLEKQPDPPPPSGPEPEPEDEDRAQVLATLKKAGIRPIEESLAAMAAEQEEDDTEGYEGYDEEEDEEE